MEVNERSIEGEVRLDGKVLRFVAPSGAWELPVEKVKAVIEYTTEEGPFVPDHFLALVDDELNEYHLPLAADGIRKVLEELGRDLETQIRLELSSSTTFQSHVLYPTALKGSNGYDLQRVPISFVRKIFRFGEETEMVLSSEVCEALRADV